MPQFESQEEGESIKSSGKETFEMSESNFKTPLNIR